MLSEGAVIAAAGIVSGIVGGLALVQVVGGYITAIRIPDALPVAAAASVLVAAALVASLIPAARASRIDVMQALREE